MENNKPKTLLLLFLMISNLSLILGMKNKPSELELAAEFHCFLKLPCELRIKIIEDLIANAINSGKTFQQLKQVIGNLRLTSSELKQALDYLFNEKFVLDFEDNGISVYQLAKILLSQENWTKFKAEYDQKQKAYLSYISNIGNTNENLEKFNEWLKIGNLDFHLKVPNQLLNLNHQLQDQLFNLGLQLPDQRNQTTLTIAIRYNKLEIVESLIKARANIDLQDSSGNTALILAAIFGHTEIVKLLIGAGAELDIYDKHARTALICAAINGCTEIVRLLVQAGANLNLQNKNGLTALIAATIKGHTEIIILLIKAGADLDLQDSSGNTALMAAIAIDSIEIVKLLIEAGANLNFQNKNGRTALITAIVSNKIFQLMIDNGIALITPPNMTSIRYNKIKIIKLLIKAGANLDAQDRHGSTALMWAAYKNHTIYKNHTEIVRILIEANVNPYLKDRYGRTAYNYAIKKNNQEIQKLLAPQPTLADTAISFKNQVLSS